MVRDELPQLEPVALLALVQKSVLRRLCDPVERTSLDRPVMDDVEPRILVPLRPLFGNLRHATPKPEEISEVCLNELSEPGIRLT
jgi:hypothetical protein